MKAVGIKVLKAKLSEYVRQAKAGETILVTERDEVVAELRPARRQPLGQGTLVEGLEALAARGEATLASQEIGTWEGLQTRARLEKVSSREILEALRKESR